VDEPDPAALYLHHPPLRQRCLQGWLVHVPEDGLDRRVGLDLAQHRSGNDVARVEDQVGPLELADAAVREPPRPAWQVRVGDDRDARQGERKRPSR
jgi:hypothetical protein